MTVRRPLFLVCLAALSLLASSCASLRSYTHMTRAARADLSAGRFDNALSSFPESSAWGSTTVLVRLERGILLQQLGRYEESARELEQANAKIGQYEDRAVISASKTASWIGSLLVNEQVIPYQGEDFEKILVHAYDAVNYLMRGDLEGSRVEILGAYKRQTQLYEKHEKDLSTSRNETPSANWEDSFRSADAARYDAVRNKADSVRSIYQNAFAYYLSALVYEMGGEDDEAYVDLKKGIAAAPWSRDMQRDLIRLSRKLNVPADTEKYQAAYGRLDKEYGRGVDVFVIFQVGMAPVKEELKLPFFLSQGGLGFVSLPVYRFVSDGERGGRITCGGVAGDTTALYDLDAAAARTLLDQYPILFAKQVARAYLKARMTNQLSRKYGAAGAVGGTLVSVITEQADLRTWSMLPREIQVARLFVPEGSRSLTVRAASSPGETVVDIPEKTRHLVVLCRATEAGLFVQTKAF